MERENEEEEERVDIICGLLLKTLPQPLLFGHSCVSVWTSDPREIYLWAGLNQSDSPSL